MPLAPSDDRLLPLDRWSRADRAATLGVLTDIDDTLTTEGAITPEALAALAALRAAGLPVIAVTGRPVGWSLERAGGWPLDAVVAENGAVALVPAACGRFEKRYVDGAGLRAANFARMQQMLAHIEATVPGARRSDDSAGRETDIAIDHSEHARLDAATIDRVVAAMQAGGLHATVSSIHVNGWYGAHDKASGAAWAVRMLLGRDLAAEADRWVYVGDSTNDERMFATFTRQGVGVANIDRFVPRLRALPRYRASRARGAGFAEMAGALLAARGG